MTHGGEIIQPLRICGLMLTQRGLADRSLRRFWLRPAYNSGQTSQTHVSGQLTRTETDLLFRVNSVGGASTLALASRVFSRLCLHDVL